MLEFKRLSVLTQWCLGFGKNADKREAFYRGAEEKTAGEETHALQGVGNVHIYPCVQRIKGVPP